MWYFTWILGLGFAVLLSVLNAMWLENETNRFNSFKEDKSQQSESNGTISEAGERKA